MLVRLRVEHLFAIEALAIVAFFASIWPLLPHDFWWHLRIGELVAATGRIPDSNMFSWSLPPETPFHYAAWLSEWLLFQLYSLGSLELVMFVNTALTLVAWAVVAGEAKRRSGAWKLTGFVVVLGAVISAENVIVRPQMWVLPLFAVELAILSRVSAGRLPPRWLLAVPAIVGVWTNLHGSFVVGLALLGMFAAGESIRFALRRPDAIAPRTLAWLYGSAALAALATLANPRGLGIFAYVQKLMTDRPSQQLIGEWQPPGLSDITNVAFFASVVFLLSAMAYSRRFPGITDAIVLGGFLWLAWNGQRYSSWYAMAAMPIVAGLLAARRRSTPATSLSGEQRAAFLPASPLTWRTTALNWAIAALLVAPLLALQPWSQYSVPMSRLFGHDPLDGVRPAVSEKTPVAATEYLRANPGGRLFNEMGYGSYLIWALRDQPVFIDTRVELYPYEQWLDYIAISNGRESEERLARYGADRVLLSRHEQAPLSNSLASSGRWQREYADDLSEVWRHSP